MIRTTALMIVAFGVGVFSPKPALASDWLDQALESGEDLWRDAEEVAGDAADTVGRWAEDTGDWFDRQFRDGEALTAEQVSQFVADIETVNAYADRAGYDLDRFDVTLGAVPNVHLHYAVEDTPSSEDLADLVEQIERDELSILQRYVLSSLLTARAYSDQLGVGDYALEAVRITLAVPPSVRLAFSPDE